MVDENDFESMENDLLVLDDSVSIKDHMQEIISNKEDEDSFYVMDVGMLVKQFHLWKELLPSIQPYYAVKCNDSKILMETLSSLGVGFDCASKEEIRKALQAGAKTNEIIYANPSKPVSHLKYAESKGVSLMTFDSICELHKVKKHFPNAKLVLRIRVDAAEGTCLIALGGKFGCEPSSALELLQQAVSLDLNVEGISFHVGTGCYDTEAYARGVHTASEIFSQAKKVGINLKYLDLGGGFPGDSVKTFEQIAELINEALKKEAAVLEGVKLIAEPGRFFGCKAFTLATSIISVRNTETHDIYFINNGIYTSFNCVPTEKAKLQPLPFHEKFNRLKKSVIWGQTMEETDKVVDECWLPEMKSGDWLYFTSMGAYSTCLSIKFYGYSVPRVYPVIHENEWTQLKNIISGHQTGKITFNKSSEKNKSTS